MKRLTSVEKIRAKRQLLVGRTARALNKSEQEAAKLLGLPRHQSIRLNPLKANPDTILAELRALGWQGSAYTWCIQGFTVDSPLVTVRDSALVAEGKVFIQNAASWLPVLALEPAPGEAILDICAAPGGKTSHIAALTDNKAHIWANDNSRPRLAKLQATMQRLGAAAEQYTLYDATFLARKLQGQQFDKILLDAPCSGEGLMHFATDSDFATWSVAHIKRLQQLQKRIAGQAWQLLKPGGTLVYSTCTMAPEENEAVIDYMLRTRSGAHVLPLDVALDNRAPAVRSWNGKAYSPEISRCVRLYPSQHLEAFFVCKLQKFGSPD